MIGPKARTVLAVAGSGLPGLAWGLPCGLSPLSHPPLEPGDPAEGPPDQASCRCRGPADPQVPDVPYDAGGLQPAPWGLPRPHLPPHPPARLLRPPRGGERARRLRPLGRGGCPRCLPLAWVLAVGTAPWRGEELVLHGFRAASGVYPCLPGFVFVCACVFCDIISVVGCLSMSALSVESVCVQSGRECGCGLWMCVCGGSVPGWACVSPCLGSVVWVPVVCCPLVVMCCGAWLRSKLP